jgi:hypothetical protein
MIFNLKKYNFYTKITKNIINMLLIYSIKYIFM